MYDYTPNCPYCSKKIKDPYEYFLDHVASDEQVFIDCPHCDKPLVLTRYIDISYDAERVSHKVINPVEECLENDKDI